MPEEFLFANIAGEQGALDVIFVHGLGGDAVETWSHPEASEPEGAYWPKWLGVDVPGLALYALGYPASWLVRWAKKEMDLYERAKQVLETLAGYGFGKRPIAFVCHSLGGLLAKQIIRTALESQDSDWRAIGTSSRAIFFIATPHRGSAMANVFKQFASGLSSAHMSVLQQDNPELIALNDACRQNCVANNIEVHVYYEKFGTRIGVVVDQASSDPGIGTNSAVPIDSDHIDICRPPTRDHTLYLGIKRRLTKLVEGLPRPVEAGTSFDPDLLGAPNPRDRRDLHQKLLDGSREHEYGIANDAQNKFARQYTITGLRAERRRINDDLLADVQELFDRFVYHAKICQGASASEVDRAVWDAVIEPTVKKYYNQNASSATARNALYFLTEKCHIRWDVP